MAQATKQNIRTFNEELQVFRNEINRALTAARAIVACAAGAALNNKADYEISDALDTAKERIMVAEGLVQGVFEKQREILAFDRDQVEATCLAIGVRTPPPLLRPQVRRRIKQLLAIDDARRLAAKSKLRKLPKAPRRPAGK